MRSALKKTAFCLMIACCGGVSGTTDDGSVKDAGTDEFDADMDSDGADSDADFCDPPANLAPELFVRGCTKLDDVLMQMIALWNSTSETITITEIATRSDVAGEFTAQSACGGVPFDIASCRFCELALTWNPELAKVNVESFGEVAVTYAQGDKMVTTIIPLCALNGLCPKEASCGE